MFKLKEFVESNTDDSFQDEGIWRRQFEKEIKFTEGEYCPHCGGSKIYKMKQGEKPGERYRCQQCKKDSTLKTGTIFQESKLGFNKLFYCLWMVVKGGYTTIEMGEKIGSTQKTAYYLQRELKDAIKDGEIDFFHRVVVKKQKVYKATYYRYEIHEIFVSAPNNDEAGRLAEKAEQERDPRRVIELQERGEMELIDCCEITKEDKDKFIGKKDYFKGLIIYGD